MLLGERKFSFLPVSVDRGGLCWFSPPRVGGWTAAVGWLAGKVSMTAMWRVFFHNLLIRGRCVYKINKAWVFIEEFANNGVLLATWLIKAISRVDGLGQSDRRRGVQCLVLKRW